jgi:FkbM family methyltransferase
MGAFDRLAGGVRPIVLFGAGALGRLVAERLHEVNAPAVAFADNNRQLWGTHVAGLPVLSTAEAIRRYGTQACFVVTIFTGASKIRSALIQLGCEHVMPFVPLFWKYSDVFVPEYGIDLPHAIRESEQRLRECYVSLADEASKREFRGQLRWRYWLDYEALSAPEPYDDMYFPGDLVVPAPEEVFVDCGAFDGRSAANFLRHRNGCFGRVYSFEPDAKNRELLESYRSGLPDAQRARICVMPYAVAAEDGGVSFTATASMASKIAPGGNQVVECRKLDSIAWEQAPTYIKMDIEGAEPDALRGAVGVIRKHMPVLAICVYHRSEHLWEIPNLIREIAPDYSLHLRRYVEECWEMVCYAVPKHRLISARS